MEGEFSESTTSSNAPSNTPVTGDVSNKTIVVLVVLTVIISILGTVVVLNEVSNMKFESPRGMVSGSGSSTGKVSLEIIEEPKPVSTTGMVMFEIK